MYPVEKNSKMPANKGQMWPAIFLTPQKYSEMWRSDARSGDRQNNHSLIAIWASLLWKQNSLFLKNISLLSDFKFPVNFGEPIAQIQRIASNYGGIHAHD